MRIAKIPVTGYAIRRPAAIDGWEGDDPVGERLRSQLPDDCKVVVGWIITLKLHATGVSTPWNDRSH
jgi:hypothetical protein